MKLFSKIVLGSLVAAASAFSIVQDTSAQEKVTIKGTDGTTIYADVLETFMMPWAMALLPDGHSLVTEKTGDLWVLDTFGKKRFKVAGLPNIDARGQGGLGDIIVHPDYADNGLVFLSYVEREANNDQFSGAIVERAVLTVSDDGASLSERQIIWRQAPKMTGNGHYAHRLAISSDGHLFITSGDRQKFNPAQNMASNLGKVVRINIDGSAPQDNPFYGNGAVTDQIWTLGHRNPLGMDFDAKGNLWVHEMGPKHGDELNLIERGRNYGYPIVSQGVHYSDVDIPNHETNPVFMAPAAYWVPAISPAGFIIYKGDKFADWTGDGFIGGLSSKALVRVSFTEHERRPTLRASETARYEWNTRVREVEQSPTGDIFILEDGANARLLKLSFEP
ncbi:PQQ-dependent sugar dehydrogenase [Glaciecola sp. SC05]|uniref:PQQ-dependent sugar dehydrogenase n=1 Tax=Glaciecola sp. SC05 TaxID=1987355 RepID=UPI0035288FE9